MFELHLKGFKTKEQVKAFIEWYEGQGEQNACIWFECRKDAGEIDVDTMNVLCESERALGCSYAERHCKKRTAI